MSGRTRSIDVALIYELWNEYTAAATDGDIERWLSLWSDDAVQMPPGAPSRIGKEQIRQEMQPLFARYRAKKTTFQAEEVHILGNWAYSHGTFAFELMPEAGGKAKGCRGKFLSILEKQVDGSWRIAVDCFNYDTRLA